MRTFIEPVLEFEEFFEKDVLLASVTRGEDPWGDDIFDDVEV